MREEPIILQLTTEEEKYLTEMRQLTTDISGNRILAGLTVEESIWYMERTREQVRQRAGGHLATAMRQSRPRFMELLERHERARMQIVGAEIARQSGLGPTEH